MWLFLTPVCEKEHFFCPPPRLCAEAPWGGVVFCWSLPEDHRRDGPTEAAARSLCIVTKSDLIPSSHAVNFPSNKPSPGALQSQVAVVQRCSCWTFCGYFVVAYPQYVGVTVSGSARLSWLQLS